MSVEKPLISIFNILKEYWKILTVIAVLSVSGWSMCYKVSMMYLRSEYGKMQNEKISQDSKLGDLTEIVKELNKKVSALPAKTDIVTREKSEAQLTRIALDIKDVIALNNKELDVRFDKMDTRFSEFQLSFNAQSESQKEDNLAIVTQIIQLQSQLGETSRRVEHLEDQLETERVASIHPPYVEPKIITIPIPGTGYAPSDGHFGKIDLPKHRKGLFSGFGKR